MERLKGKTAIVTGASRGIGRAIAERIVSEGGRVCVTGRKAGPLGEVVTALGERVAAAVPGGVHDPAHREEVIATALDRFGSVDLLVNNVGINPVYGPLMDLDPDAARKIVEVNCLAMLALTQLAYRAWMAEHGGAVVNIASLAGTHPAPGIAFYGASKAMMISLTRDLAVELAPGVRVNAVAPAVVKTQFASALYEGREEEVANAYALKRLGAPEDVAGAVAFLLSDDAAWVTGHVLMVDGGITLTRGV